MDAILVIGSHAVLDYPIGSLAMHREGFGWNSFPSRMILLLPVGWLIIGLPLEPGTKCWIGEEADGSPKAVE
jgi:hypothetical protein